MTQVVPFQLNDKVTAAGGHGVGVIVRLFEKEDPVTGVNEEHAEVEYTTGRVVTYSTKFLNRYIPPHSSTTVVNA